MTQTRPIRAPIRWANRAALAAPTVSLGVLFLALAVASFGSGGFDAVAWSGALLLICCAALAYHILTPAAWKSPRPTWSLRITFGLLTGLIGLQLLPLPNAWFSATMPARTSLLAPLGEFSLSSCCASISVAPRETFLYLVRLLACAQVFLLCRELAWRFRTRVSMLAWPIVVVGVLQSVLGFSQYAADPAQSVATGTYLNRNHFAGFLEMCLPFLLIQVGTAIEDQRARRGPLSLGNGIRMALLFSFVVCMMLAQLRSLSRLGAIAMFLSVGTVIILSFSWRRSLASMGKLALVLAVFLGASIALLPDRLVARYAASSAMEDLGAYDVRFFLWRDCLAMAADFPLLGIGAGAFSSVFPAYQTAASHSWVQYAHNDYLQALCELGAVGSLFFLGLLAQLLLPGWHTLRDPRLARRMVSAKHYTVAAMAAMLALLFHSLGDYNLNVPVNALAFAWIAGLAAGLDPSVEQVPARFSRI